MIEKYISVKKRSNPYRIIIINKYSVVPVNLKNISLKVN